MAKNKKEQPPVVPAAEVIPGGNDTDEADYTEHLLVPVDFKERLERIAQKVNQERRRRKLPKRPLGWFVVRHLRDWMDLEEAAPPRPAEGSP